MSGAQYARLVPKKYRSRTLPKVDRPWRPRVIAWAGPNAFYPNRFYEIDKWYKARIDKPEMIPDMHIIDPANHLKSLEEVMKKTEGKTINIGFKPREMHITKKTEQDMVELEKLSRHMKLEIDTESLDFPDMSVFKHYSVFDHLFGDGVYFHNVQKIDINYGDNEVQRGNIITASSTSQKPQVEIESVGKGYTTLLMVNIDGNAFEKNGEVIQWLVSNIPDGQTVESGNEICEYLQPLPFYGTGYHRVAFVLFHHLEPINIDLKISENLPDRTHKISDLYKANETVLTPSAIRLFQTSYDDSVKTTLHKMGLKSPLYEYEYNKPLKPDQREYPRKPQPFDLYLDMYRDPKDVHAEMLEKRLESAQLDDYKAPKWRDIDYNENKKKYPEWLHSRMISREGVHMAKYENKLD